MEKKEREMMIEKELIPEKEIIPETRLLSEFHNSMFSNAPDWWLECKPCPPNYWSNWNCLKRCIKKFFAGNFDGSRREMNNIL